MYSRSKKNHFFLPKYSHRLIDRSDPSIKRREEKIPASNDVVSGPVTIIPSQFRGDLSSSAGAVGVTRLNVNDVASRCRVIDSTHTRSTVQIKKERFWCLTLVQSCTFSRVANRRSVPTFSRHPRAIHLPRQETWDV